jgi:hypothetical protein
LGMTIYGGVWGLVMVQAVVSIANCKLV